MRADLGDRYGPLPDDVETLLRFALLKSNAQQIGIEAVDRRGGALNIKFHPGSKIEPARLMTLVSSRPGAQFTPAGVLRLPLPQSGEETPGDGRGVLAARLSETGSGSRNCAGQNVMRLLMGSSFVMSRPWTLERSE